MQGQPQELLLDDSQEVIALDKPTLVFILNPTPTPDMSGIYGKSECIILVKNLTNNHVAIRTKTTKKDVYAVNPTYGTINPAQTFEIKFVYYIKDLRENPKKHKFKFEGIIYDPNTHPNKDSKTLFDYFISTRTKVKGTTVRREVEFNFLNSPNQGRISNLGNVQNISSSVIVPNNNNNLPDFANVPNVGKSLIYASVIENPPQSTDNVFSLKNFNNNSSPNNPNLVKTANEVPFQPNLNLNTKENPNNMSNQNSSKPLNKELEKQLQDMKIEYYKYKHQLNNLTETYKNLKSRADIEKKGPDSNLLSGANFNVTQSYKEEKQVNKNTVLILFVVSILLGFFLSR